MDGCKTAIVSFKHHGGDVKDCPKPEGKVEPMADSFMERERDQVNPNK